jgi:hypothetical protein
MNQADREKYGKKKGMKGECKGNYDKYKGEGKEK